ALNSGQICAECNKTFCKDYMKENCSDANGKFADENGKGKEGCEIQVTATCFDALCLLRLEIRTVDPINEYPIDRHKIMND
ncbi:31418_t:CDS:2, partial [Gigaspora margarita]